MAAAPEADIVVIAPHGLERFDSPSAVWRAIPLRGSVRTTWWRTPAQRLPTEPRRPEQWPLAQWSTIDHRIDRVAGPGP
jgi:hypothetical protein